MKNLTVIAIVFFVSCSNPKERIVDQIKTYKDSSRVVLDSIVKITVDESLMQEKLFYTNGRIDDKKYNDANKKLYEEYQEKNRDEQMRLKLKGSVYQNKIDSLELELKKY